MRIRWIVVYIVSSLAVGVLVYAGVYHWNGQLKRAEFERRPELENWTMPYLGAEHTAIPAGVAAGVLFGAVVAVIWGIRRLREER